MNETVQSASMADTPRPNGDHRVRVPDASMLLGSEKATPAAGETLHAMTDQLRETKDEWVEGVRSTVRSNPLVSAAAAVVLGALIARITR